MEGFRGDQEKILLSIEKFGGYKPDVKNNKKKGEASTNKVKEEKHLEISGGLREDIGIKTYWHGPMNYAKTLKLRFRVGDPDLPERRKRYNSSREEGVVTHKICARVAQQ